VRGLSENLQPQLFGVALSNNFASDPEAVAWSISQAIAVEVFSRATVTDCAIPMLIWLTQLAIGVLG
jgi:hypothetical protein